MKRFICLLSIAIIAIGSVPVGANEQTITISKVESVEVISVRKLSEADLLRDQSRGWALFGNAMIGGVLGYKHGGGSANDVKNVLNSVLRHNSEVNESNELTSAEKLRLYEIQVRGNDGKRKTIVMSNNNNTVYRANDKLRLVHFETGVFIDKIL